MLKTLCELCGTSGREEAVREYILRHLPTDCTHEIDALGNLYVYKKGAKRAKNKVMLFSHMDEVALIVTYITEDGYLKFTPVGGVDERVIFGKSVRVGEQGISGVIGAKAIHQVPKAERNNVPKAEDLYIDIGATSKAEAERYVSLGDNAYFDGDYVEFGDGFIRSKAIDDRAGNAVMLEMLHEDLPFDMGFCFTVQEEVGTRGATAAAYHAKPDYALVLESTTAADLPDVTGFKKVCTVGGGVVVSFMDGGTVYDHTLYREAMALAEANGIAAQTKTRVAGGNDAAAIHKAAGGIRTLALSVPCRYLHSPSCVAKLSDIESLKKLARTLSEAYADA